ncbi:uncharacterized protein RNJ42_03675 [Nakaseomyces bracarensis]
MQSQLAPISSSGISQGIDSDIQSDSRGTTMLSGTLSYNGDKTSTMSTSNPRASKSQGTQSNIISQDYAGTASKINFNWVTLVIISLFLI